MCVCGVCVWGGMCAVCVVWCGARVCVCEIFGPVKYMAAIVGVKATGA